MSIIDNVMTKLKARKEKVREIEENYKIERKITERRKNANEREYERYVEEERQKQIESELKKFRQQKSNDIWNTNCFTNNKNLFNGANTFQGNHGQRWGI